MKQYTVNSLVTILDPNNLGITQRSLRTLRNEIACRLDNELLVLQIPTGDITCGYLIVDRTAGEAVFTGDGFRTDGGGEGGAGYRAAEAYLDVFRLNPYVCEPVDISEAYTGNTSPVMAKLLEIARDVAQNLSERFTVPSETMPSYMRGHLR